MDTEPFADVGERCGGDERQEVELGLDLGTTQPLDLSMPNYRTNRNARDAIYR
jgi:hypothetical protein